jgi:cytochrome c
MSSKDQTMNTMTRTAVPILLSIAVVSLLIARNAHAEGDPRRGAQQFRQCAACHSVAPGEHLTGPSLAGVVGRAAASGEGFGRYSRALRESGIVWTEETLHKWLQDPAGLVPGTSMRIRGIADETVREDVIAFLGTADQSGNTAESDDGGSAGMMGGMGSPRLMNLKQVAPNQQVRSIRYCGDAYYVTLGTGRTYTFWEFNLRFKSDSSQNGPPEGQPTIVSSGMRGDRAFVIFADPGEISGFVRKEC